MNDTATTDAEHDDRPAILSKDEAKKRARANRAKPDWIYVDEWETRVDIKRLDAGQNEVCVAAGRTDAGWSEFHAALKRIELGCIEPAFDLDDDDDFEFLRTSDPATIYALNAAIMILSKTREGDIAAWQRRFPAVGDGPEVLGGADVDGEGGTDSGGEGVREVPE